MGQEKLFLTLCCSQSAVDGRSGQEARGGATATLEVSVVVLGLDPSAEILLECAGTI